MLASSWCRALSSTARIAAAAATTAPGASVGVLPPVHFVPRSSKLAPLGLSEALRLLRAIAHKPETFTLTAAVSTVDKSKKKNVARDPFSRVVVLPHTFRPRQNVVAFVDEALVAGALASGAVAAGGRELIPRIAAGDLVFDLCVATPEMALALKADASVLKRNMPSVKKGTVSDKVLPLVQQFVSGTPYKTHTNGQISIGVGKTDFDDAQMTANITSFLADLDQARLSKAAFILNVSLKTTTGPCLPLDAAGLLPETSQLA